MEVLLNSKNEYIVHLLDLFTLPLTKRIYDLFNSSLNIKEFQQKLVNIKRWNNNLIQEEYKSIIKQ